MGKILSVSQVYACPLFSVEERKIEFTPGKVQTHWIVVRNPYVGVVAITENDEVVMIEESRSGGLKLDLPGGKYEQSEVRDDQLLSRAKAELEEETGYQAENWELLDTQEVKDHWHERKYYYFLAKNLQFAGTRLEPGEEIKTKLLSITEIKSMINAGKLPGYLVRILEKAI